MHVRPHRLLQEALDEAATALGIARSTFYEIVLPQLRVALLQLIGVSPDIVLQ